MSAGAGAALATSSVGARPSCASNAETSARARGGTGRALARPLRRRTARVADGCACKNPCMRPRGSPRSQPVREPTLSELALAEIKAREEQEKPFGGWGGEMVMVPATLQAPPMYTPRYRVPEVDW